MSTLDQMNPFVIAVVGLGWTGVSLVVWSVLYASGEWEEEVHNDV